MLGIGRSGRDHLDFCFLREVDSSVAVLGVSSTARKEDEDVFGFMGEFCCTGDEKETDGTHFASKAPRAKYYRSLSVGFSPSFGRKVRQIL